MDTELIGGMCNLDVAKGPWAGSPVFVLKRQVDPSDYLNPAYPNIPEITIVKINGNRSGVQCEGAGAHNIGAHSELPTL
jgi:hypothetical protein